MLPNFPARSRWNNSSPATAGRITAAVLFLSSSHPSYITGTTLGHGRRLHRAVMYNAMTGTAGEDQTLLSRALRVLPGKWRPKELHAPGSAKGIQRVAIRPSIRHDLTEPQEKALSVHARQYHHNLTSRSVGNVDECMSIATGNADQFSCTGFEASAIHFEQVPAFEYSKYLRFAMPMQRWTESRRIHCLYDGQGSSRSVWRQPHGKLKTKRRNLHYGQAFSRGVEELI
jgi:hypothetical protein